MLRSMLRSLALVGVIAISTSAAEAQTVTHYGPGGTTTAHYGPGGATVIHRGYGGGYGHHCCYGGNGALVAGAAGLAVGAVVGAAASSHPVVVAPAYAPPVAYAAPQVIYSPPPVVYAPYHY